MATRRKTEKKENKKEIIPPVEDKIDPNLFDSSNITEESKATYKKRPGYFIQLHLSNIYDCFSSSLIIPSAFIDERTVDDIQTRFHNALLVTEGFIDFFDKTQCLLEIVLKPAELKDYVDQNAFLFFRPIPVTRIKRIIVLDQGVKEKVINTALTQDVGYIPDNIFSYFDASKYEKFEMPELIQTSEDIKIGKEIEIFDKILGLFAFIRNQQLYYTQTTKIFSNYSEHFLEAFSIINSEIETNYSKLIKQEFVKIFNKLFDYNIEDVSSPSLFIVNYLYSGGLIDNDFIVRFFELFSNTISEKKELIYELKNKLVSTIGKKSALKPLFEISKNFYQVAYLYIYGKKGSNDKEILKNTLREELIFSQSEITLALLGLYYGYKKLRPSESIILNDPNLERIFGSEFNVKFQLNNKLDYVLIESLYEFIFNKKCGNKNILAFEPMVNENLLFLNEIKKDPDLEFEFDIELFGSHYYRIKKQSDFDKISRLLSVYPEKLESHYHLVALIRKYYDKDLYILRGASGVVFKNEFLKQLGDEKLRIINFNHVIACVELDKKFNLK